MHNGDIATLTGPWLSGDSIAGFEPGHQSSTRLPIQEVESVDVSKADGFKTSLIVVPLVALGILLFSLSTSDWDYF